MMSGRPLYSTGGGSEEFAISPRLFQCHLVPTWERAWPSRDWQVGTWNGLFFFFSVARDTQATDIYGQTRRCCELRGPIKSNARIVKHEALEIAVFDESLFLCLVHEGLSAILRTVWSTIRCIQFGKSWIKAGLV